MENTIRWVGIDAHKDSLNIAVLEGFASKATEWKIEHTTASVKRLTKKLVKDGRVEVRACYEAGPTGYELQRVLGEVSFLNASGTASKRTVEAPESSQSCSEPVYSPRFGLRARRKRPLVISAELVMRQRRT
ncbi:MAG: hypothetical protein AAFZ18_09180 [Myxococcota bacterium]